MSRLISNSLRTTKNPFLLTCHYNHNNVLLNEVTIKTLHSRYGNQLNARVVALRCYHPKLNQNLLNQKTTLVSSQYNNNRSLHTTNCLWESSTKNSTSPTTSTTTAAAATPAPSNTAAAAAATSTTSTTANIYERTKNRGPVSWPSLLLVGVAAASAVAYYQIERERRLEKAMGKIVSSEYNNDKDDGWTPRPDYLAKRKFIPTKFGWFPMADGFGAPGKPAIGGPWSAVDMDGNLVTNKSFEGKWLLLYFGFARCPDICPSEMMKVGKVMDQLNKEHPELAKDLIPIFVSIDPARDSIRALKVYANDFHPKYIFLTGSPTQIKDMAKKYRVYYSKADETADGDYLVDHSIVIYFHDNTGDLADCFTQSMRPSDLIEKIVERMTATPSIAM